MRAEPDRHAIGFFTLRSSLITSTMIRIVLYQNTNQKIKEAYGKWFPRVVSEETIGLEELADHMASHNTPYSKGAILGMLTDAATCTKELLLLGKNVKFADIAIFSLGLIVKEGADTKDDFSVAKNIAGLRLRARATGELKTKNLDTTIKRIDLATSTSTSDTNKPSGDGGGSDTGGSGSSTGGSGSGTTPSGGSGTDQGGASSGGSSSDGGGDTQYE